MRHLARLGGVIVHPRATLIAILDGGEGKAWELFPWLAIVSAAAAPIEAGRALLLLRVDPLTGVWAFLSMITGRTAAGLVGAVVAAFALGLWKIPFDRAFDCAMYMLVPFLALMALGAGLSLLDAEIWFMPHRRMTGVAWVIAVRALVAYGWSLILFGLVVREVLSSRPRVR